MKMPDSLPPLSSRDQRRSAGATIAGYLYQFERSVVEILSLGPNGISRVEGIEDIDIWSESPSVIQIKYHAAQHWSLSKVREPIYEMLKSFANGLRVNYVLYVYFGNGDNPPPELDVDELKECLTYQPQQRPAEYYYKDFSEEVLAAFAESLEIRTGISLDAQRKLTVAAIAEALECDEIEAEILHRMRAVQFLHEIAVNKDEEQRRVTRANLLRHLNVRDIFYNKWHRETISHEKFLNAAVKKLKRLDFNSPNIYRGVLLELEDNNVEAVGHLAVELANDLNGELKRRTTSAKPWTLVLRGHDYLIIEVKRRLIDECIHFNDGYESIRFSPELYSLPPLVYSNGKSSRLKKTSYQLRIISEDSFQRSIGVSQPLAQLIVLFQPDDWHSEVVATAPTPIYELNVEGLRDVIRKVTT